MSVDEITKLIYAIGITGSVVGLSIFLMRLIHKLTQRVEESEKTLANIDQISEKLANNMELIEETVQMFSSTVRKIKNNFLDPLDDLAGVVKIAKEVIGMFSKKDAGDSADEIDSK
ncbi:MAG TPA: hypothetical protein ENI23_10065 [bacterium]|nr:hypothetical protein [bacterium]